MGRGEGRWERRTEDRTGEDGGGKGGMGKEDEYWSGREQKKRRRVWEMKRTEEYSIRYNNII